MDILSKNKYVSLNEHELWEKLSIDYCYFVATNGGVTFGGGEPLIYAEDILKFKNVIPDGMRIYIETSLSADIDDDLFIRFLDKDNPFYFIIDIKTLDEKLYKAYTGFNIANMKRRLKIIADLNLVNQCKIRIPIIPEYKTEDIAKTEAKTISSMGFKNYEVFNYIKRDYMFKS